MMGTPTVRRVLSSWHWHLIFPIRAAYVREATRFKSTRAAVNVPARNEAVLKQAEQEAVHIGLPVTISRAAMGAILNSSVAFEECIVSNISNQLCNSEICAKIFIEISLTLMTRISECFLRAGKQRGYSQPKEYVHLHLLFDTPYSIVYSSLSRSSCDIWASVNGALRTRWRTSKWGTVGAQLRSPFSENHSRNDTDRVEVFLYCDFCSMRWP